MRKVLLGLMALLAFSAFAQSTHTIDFEPAGVGADWAWPVGENDDNPPLEFVINPDGGGINASATAAKFTARAAGNAWALCYTEDNLEFTFDADNAMVKIMVYKSNISNVGLKFEGLSGGKEILLPNTVTDEWEEITFDFSEVIGNTYKKLVIIPDFEARAEDHILYFDNIQLPEGSLNILPEPTTVPPTPSHAAEDVLSIYSDTYINLADVNYNPWWWQATQVTVDYVAAGNNTLKYEGLNYQGTEWASQDVSGFEYVHVDFWTPNSTNLNFFVISPDKEIGYALPMATEEWVSVDIPLSAFVPPVDLTDVFQFKVDGNGTVYFDNWYFWKTPVVSGTDATLGDLMVDGTTIDGFSPTILNYDMELPIGTTIVPTVTATTNDPLATYAITDAISLPGTSEVEVTSMDGSTTLIYAVNYTLSSPEPTTAPADPTHAEEDVISIYTELYTNVPGTDFNPSWGQSTSVTLDYPAAGNNIIKYENLNYQGTQYANQDVSGMEYLHVDFWTPNSTQLDFYLIGDGGETSYALPITAETWVSVDIPLSNYVPPVNLADVFQFKVEGNGTVYFDNWYFWKTPVVPGSDATLSDLLVDGTTIDGFSPSTNTYSVELPFGSTEVPVVTAVTSGVEATYIINDATALPGTTDVVVTSANETNVKTYSIEFTVAGETPSSEWCGRETWHFDNPAEVPSAIFLTITNVDASSMFIEIESATDDPVDLLLVNGGSGASVSDPDISVPGKISRTLTWTDTPPADVSLNLLWSKDSFGGNWQLSQSDITVPFGASCSVSTKYQAGWSGISSNVMPEAKISMEDLFAPIEDDMVILVGKTGIYWPGYNTNTLGEWDTYQGYKVKFENGVNFEFLGSELTDRTVTLEPGIYYIPVLSEGEASVEELILPLGDAIEFMFDITNSLIYWPTGGIIPGGSSSLETMYPGFAYLTKVNETVTVDFGTTPLTKASSTPTRISTQFANTNWNNVSATGIQHMISVNTSNLLSGDVLGAFDAQGLCVGVAQLDKNDQMMPLVVFGNDVTTDTKDGLEQSEAISFMIYRNGVAMEVTAVYNEAVANHNGLFAENGLSIISDFKMGTTSINSTDAETFSIYPNPNNGHFTISSLNDGVAEFMLVNIQGQAVYSSEVTGSVSVDLSNQPKGVYFVRLSNTSTTSIQKIVIE